MGRVVGRRTRRLEARIRKAARLWKREAIEPLDYAVLVVDAIARMEGADPSGQDFHRITFATQAARALGFPASPDSQTLPGSLGPIHRAVEILSKAFPVYDGAGDQYNPATFQFTWGSHCDEELWKSKRRLRLVNRIYEGVNRWRAREAEFAPRIHDDAWKVVIGVIGLIIGVVIGHFTS